VAPLVVNATGALEHLHNCTLLVHLKDAQVVLKALQEGKNQDIEEWMKGKLPKITKEHVLGFSTKQRLASIEELTGEFKEIGDTL